MPTVSCYISVREKVSIFLQTRHPSQVRKAVTLYKFGDISDCCEDLFLIKYIVQRFWSVKYKTVLA